MKIDVLDHGYVRLVSYMQPVPSEPEEVQDFNGTVIARQVRRDADWTGDLEIVRNARVSYNADWRGTPENPNELLPEEHYKSKDEKLINYLYEHAHTSPFEAMVFTFEVQAPIFVFRQWHRHRTWSYNEVSARYTELPDLFYIPDPDHIGYQSKSNKQGRTFGGEDVNAVKTSENAKDFCIDLRDQCKLAFDRYQDDLQHGIPRELARMGLPVNVYSRMFSTVDLHNLFRFLTLRLDSHAQMEIRVYAEALLRLIEPIVPVAAEAFKKGIYEADPLNPPPGLDRDE